MSYLILNKCYVYAHIREDKNEIFYIGIGRQKDHKRAYEKTGRNNIWNGISNRSPYIVKILHDNITWEEACEIERQLIKLYGRIDLNTGILCNMTNGGDGVNGYTRTKEEQDLLTAKLTGLKRSDQFRKRISEAQKGNKNGIGKRSVEFGDRIRQAKLGVKLSESHKANMSKAFKGKHQKPLKGGVIAYKDGIEVGRYIGAEYAAEELNCHISLVGAVLLGQRKTTNGFTFKRVA